MDSPLQLCLNLAGLQKCLLPIFSLRLVLPEIKFEHGMPMEDLSTRKSQTADGCEILHQMVVHPVTFTDYL